MTDPDMLPETLPEPAPPAPKPWGDHGGPRPDLPPWHPLNVEQPGDTEVAKVDRMNQARDASFNRMFGPR